MVAASKRSNSRSELSMVTRRVSDGMTSERVSCHASNCFARGSGHSAHTLLASLVTHSLTRRVTVLRPSGKSRSESRKAGRYVSGDWGSTASPTHAAKHNKSYTPHVGEIRGGKRGEIRESLIFLESSRFMGKRPCRLSLPAPGTLWPRRKRKKLVSAHFLPSSPALETPTQIVALG
jgi:hypothetical protein